MADFVFDKALTSLGSADIDLLVDDIRVVLVGSGYTPSQTGDEFLSAILLADRIATSSALSGKSLTGGVFDATDPVFTALTGSQVTQAVIVLWTGTASTTRLIHWENSYTGLPYTPSGADLTYQFPNDANKAFKI